MRNAISHLRNAVSISFSRFPTPSTVVKESVGFEILFFWLYWPELYAIIKEVNRNFCPQWRGGG
jgi:hypothetical protein